MSNRLRREGYSTVNSYFMVKNAHLLIEFMEKAFGGKSHDQTMNPDGTIANAEVQIGDSRVMVAEARDNWTPMPCHIYLYVPDTDATYKKAISAGATSVMEPADMFYGDRNGGVRDSCGNYWWIATKIKDVPQEEIQQKHEERFKQQSN